uniref:Uncharacterized protein n=1 Tax=Lepeophtheirus salmonis TaxID=72036 RepID=A0A0K2UD15_LEPSM
MFWFNCICSTKRKKESLEVRKINIDPSL